MVSPLPRALGVFCDGHTPANTHARPCRNALTLANRRATAHNRAHVHALCPHGPHGGRKGQAWSDARDRAP
eukprot:12261232-Alexandrium_andersonii.AAC.1